MPLNPGAEQRWAYYVPQPIPDDAVQPPRRAQIKLFDPALGSGHFHVVAFDLLVALYREEARHRGEQKKKEWSPTGRLSSVSWNTIFTDSTWTRGPCRSRRRRCGSRPSKRVPRRTHGISTWWPRTCGWAICETTTRRWLSCVARWSRTPASRGITDTLVHALKGADYLGSLLKIDAAVDEAISRHEHLLQVKRDEGLLFAEMRSEQQQLPLDRAETRATVVNKLEEFLGSHTGGDDLGLRSMKRNWLRRAVRADAP